jgi:leader peptidase (prepilin peptidase)/N-methyltransferase
MWIGFGDVKLCLGLALLLADWRLAFIALFAANLIGSLAVLPGLMMKKLKGNSHVPFGPLLIAGFLVAGLFGIHILDWYQHLILF